MEMKSLCAAEECGVSRQCKKTGRSCSEPRVEKESRMVNGMITHSLLDSFEPGKRSSDRLW